MKRTRAGTPVVQGKHVPPAPVSLQWSPELHCGLTNDQAASTTLWNCGAYGKTVLGRSGTTDTISRQAVDSSAREALHFLTSHGTLWKQAYTAHAMYRTPPACRPAEVAPWSRAGPAAASLTVDDALRTEYASMYCVAPEELIYLAALGKAVVGMAGADGSTVQLDLPGMHRLLQGVLAASAARCSLYHALRCQNWIVRSGYNFGGDYALYARRPDAAHAAWVVRSTVWLAPASKAAGPAEAAADDRDACTVTWPVILTAQRVAHSAGKRLLLADVSQPYEQPALPGVAVRRWASNPSHVMKSIHHAMKSLLEMPAPAAPTAGRISRPWWTGTFRSHKPNAPSTKSKTSAGRAAPAAAPPPTSCGAQT